MSLQEYVNTNKSKKSQGQFFSNFLNGGVGIAKSLGINGTAAAPDVKVEKPLLNGTDSHATTPERSWFPSSKFLGNENAFGLSRLQRIVGFICCLLAGIFCFVVASFYIPVLVFKARKFAALYTLGSCFFVFSFSLLLGPYNYVAHLLSSARLPMTCAYFFSLIATLYCSLWINSTILTIVCASAQCFALLWFVVSYVPGGETGLRFMTGIFGRLVSRTVKGKGTTLPV